MSGDNLHGKQPIKFYSEKITLTKVELLEKQLSLGEKVSDLDAKHKEWSKKLSDWSIPKIFFYLTFLKLGALKNIIFNEKNNNETVRAGTMYRIKSEFTKDGILAKIICI